MSEALVTLKNVPAGTTTNDVKSAFATIGVEIRGTVRLYESTKTVSVLIPREDLIKIENSQSTTLQIKDTQVELVTQKSCQVVFSGFVASGISKTELAVAIHKITGILVQDSSIKINTNGDAVVSLPKKQATLIQSQVDVLVGSSRLKVSITSSEDSKDVSNLPQSANAEPEGSAPSGRRSTGHSIRPTSKGKNLPEMKIPSPLKRDQTVDPTSETNPKEAVQSGGETNPEDPKPPATGSSSFKRKPLRTQGERVEVRRQASLPILTCQDEFIQRLQQEKVLVVTAQTGSGKTTQLPQYAAEAFDGLVICTQPRALAAISIAQRIASEYDDADPGENVGYQIGGGKQVKGRRIMMMTDSAFVRKAQKNPELKDVRVLIIDEAHERSLNTDLVIGIAKMVRAHRPHDFYVVIASATIDPKPFLNFFSDGLNIFKELSVLGRTFPVELDYHEVDSDADVLNRVLIPSLIDALETHNEGNCLVFLPGSREIDNAIKKFQQKVPDNFIALPLYGSLPPDEQARVLSFDDKAGTLRMVVFCTNVAETSLTVPNIRLVVDTGLAKEARYDPKRRITVLEQVYISKSSADQRMGRAGRTAPGHCIRLYTPAELVRPNIEPEIMRSSLDLVVLQLHRLNYNPLSFPFMSRPKEEFLHASEQLLTEFGCLAPNLNSEIQITERGILFCELPFDPRMSNFVVLANDHQCLEMASEIASILTAPGSLFFMGGSRKDAREATKQRVALAASDHESDLFFLHNIYCQWVAAGEKTSDKGTGQSQAGALRSKFASKHDLNNKVLQMVHQTKKQVLKIMNNVPSQKHTTISAELDLASKVEIIGRSLALSFKEQICELLIPNNPDAGVHLLDGVSKGIFSTTSSLSQRVGGKSGSSLSNFVVAMSITRIPSGLIIIDQAHPLQLEWVPNDVQSKITQSSLDIVECFSRTSLSDRFRYQLFRYFQKATDSLSLFIMSVYDIDSATIRVFGPRKQSSAIQSQCSTLVESQLQNELEKQYELQIVGSFRAVVTAGLQVKNVQPGNGAALRVVIKNPPTKNQDQLKKWICNVTSISPSDIKSCYYNPGSRPGSHNASTRSVTVVLNGADVVQKVLAASSKLNTSDASLSSSSSSNEDETIQTKLSLDMGNRAHLHTDQCVSLIELQNALHNIPYQPQNVRHIFSHPDTFEIKMSNIPCNIDTEEMTKILTQLPLNNMPEFASVFPPKDTVAACKGILKFSSAAHRDACLVALNQSWLASHTFTINIPPKGKARTVSPQFQCQGKPGNSEFALSFNTSNEADCFCRSAQSGGLSFPFRATVNGEASVFVPHPGLFNLQTLSQAVVSKLGPSSVAVVIKQDEKHGTRVIFNGIPSSCGQAAQLMHSMLAPLKFHFYNRPQILMLDELKKLGLLKEWAAQLGIVPAYETDNKIGKLTVHGPQISQGAFMAKIGEYVETFSERYAILPLDLISQLLFRGLRIGAACLKKLTSKLGDHGSVEFVPQQGGIEIYIAPGQSEIGETLMKMCRDEIQQVVTDSGLTVLDKQSRACVFCGESDGQPFSICGHFYCDNCLRNAIIHQAASNTVAPISCKRCQTPVSVQDIRSVLSNEAVYNKVMHDMTGAFLRQSPTHPFIICPGNGCSALLKKADCYQTCSSCSYAYCPQCGVADDYLHQNRTCTEFKKEKRAIRVSGSQNLYTLIQRARDFVKQYWPPDLPKIVRIDENPGLVRGCPAMLSFCRALEKVGYSKLQDAIFAWHGTPSEAGVIGISHDSFDPKRRSGQVYGRGEYFGQSASVSHGYSRGCNRMFIAALLAVPETSKHSNFCYVVDNPLDGSHCFNLPLLVVTYNTGLSCPEFKQAPPQPLPLYFTDANIAELSEDDD